MPQNISLILVTILAIVLATFLTILEQHSTQQKSVTTTHLASSATPTPSGTKGKSK